MKNAIILSGILVLIFSGYVSALQCSAMYEPMDARDTLASVDPKMKGMPSSSGMWQLSVELNIPEDLKLVSSSGNVLGDEVCVGDTFTFNSAIDDGEFFEEGGFVDSPPIYWVDDLVAEVKGIIDCPGSEGTYGSFSGPVYNVKLGHAMLCASQLGLPDTGLSGVAATAMTGGLACSIVEQEVDAGSAVKNGDYYEVTTPGTLDFKGKFNVLCMHYYIHPDTNKMGVALPAYVSTCSLDSGDPTNNPEAAVFYTDDVTKQIACNMIQSDTFKVAEIEFEKTLTVREACSDPSLQVDVPASETVDFGKENTLKVRVKNNGATDVKVTDITSNVDSRFITCDSATIPAGAESECLISITPKYGKQVNLNVNYDYNSCGVRKSSTALKSVVDSKVIKPGEVAQAYYMGVHGGCESFYYSCHGLGDDSTTFVGYKCFKSKVDRKDTFYTPANQRFIMKYDISGLSSGMDIASARIYITAYGVYTSQDVAIYSLSGDDWTPVNCMPGGDICAKPFCKDECQALYAPKGSLQDTVNVIAPGIYEFDVTEFIKREYANGQTYASFQLMGAEDLWNSEGSATCNRPGEWEVQHVLFHAKGMSGPYLEIIYNNDR